MLERWFKLAELRTDVRTEVLAGITTFMTMAYIIVVQPTVLQAAGMDFGAVVVATCLSSALATVLMAFLANYPIAVAPAMGHNFFFAYTVILGMKVSWEIALGAVFIAGSLFIVLSLFGLREAIIHAVPESLQHAIAVGIGLLIAMVGLQWSGIVMDSPGTLVGLGDLRGPPVLLAIFGVGTVSLLMVLKVKGAILWGMGGGLLRVPGRGPLRDGGDADRGEPAGRLSQGRQAATGEAGAPRRRLGDHGWGAPGDLDRHALH